MILFLLFSQVSFAQVTTRAPFPFEDVQNSRTVQESKDLYPARAESVLNYFASKPLGTYSRQNGTDFPIVALAKLSRGRDIEEINREILKAKPYGVVGTSFYAFKPRCVRDGDYDFSLRGWVSLIYTFGNRPDLLYPESQEWILNQLLTETGNEFATYRTYCHLVRIRETENHMLLTEGSRYLTNQLWMKKLAAEGKYDARYDNKANGMTEKMLNHMAHLFKTDFEEFNSRPYQKFTIAAIHNIYEFSEEPRVKLLAQMLLDYLAAKYAISSKSLRRSVPLCRQPEHRDDLDLIERDPSSVVMALLAGTLEFVEELPEDVHLDHWSLVGMALGTYRIPDLILDLIIHHNEAGRKFFQTLHHLGYETYYQTPEFMISAGGKFINQLDGGSGKTDAWAVPTTLLSSKRGLYKYELIRIMGQNKAQQKFNLCVAPGFACGVNVRIPETIPSECRETIGPWEFINFRNAQCPIQDDFYVAVFSKPCDSPRCKGQADNFGFFEARAASEMSYADFKHAVFARNESRSFHSHRWNEYTLSTGEKIQFIPDPRSKNKTQVRSTSTPDVKKLKEWKHADGDIIDSAGLGQIRICNPFTGKNMLLDASNPSSPNRTEE